MSIDFKARFALAGMLALGVTAPALAQSALVSPPALVGRTLSDENPPVLVAQANDTAQLMLRIQQLEEQIRSLNGQVEGLTFQLTQMQTLVQRLSEENEARFRALEGGAAGKPEAATQGGGATQPQAAPQAPANDESNVPMTDIPEQGVQPLPGEAEFDPTFDDGSVPMDDLGNSSDPLVGTGRTGGMDLTTGQPLDLSYDPATGPSGNPDADAQFRAGYEALARGDYAFAEDQFSQFIELYPDNPQVTDAANWLGDALLQRQAYSEAADVLLNAFQKAPDSPRAPELLLKLGMSLSGAGERETACRTYAEIDRRYTSLPDAVKGKLAEEKTKAECPPA